MYNLLNMKNMKKRFFVVVLLAVVVGLGACKKKSDINTIKSFRIDNVDHTDKINHSTGLIGGTFAKTGPDTWESGTPSGWPNGTVTVELSDNKAQITPIQNPINLEANVKFTVTAENGDTKVYTISFARE